MTILLLFCSAIHRPTMLLPVVCLLAVAIQYIEAMPYRQGLTAIDLLDRWPSYESAVKEIYTPFRNGLAPTSRFSPIASQGSLFDENPKWRQRLRTSVAKRYDPWRSPMGPLPSRLSRKIIKATTSKDKSPKFPMRYG